MDLLLRFVVVLKGQIFNLEYSFTGIMDVLVVKTCHERTLLSSSLSSPSWNFLNNAPPSFSFFWLNNLLYSRLVSRLLKLDPSSH